jgi:hypothetical protein
MDQLSLHAISKKDEIIKAARKEAENLDIAGADAEKIVDDAIKAYGPA